MKVAAIAASARSAFEAGARHDVDDRPPHAVQPPALRLCGRRVVLRKRMRSHHQCAVPAHNRWLPSGGRGSCHALWRWPSSPASIVEYASALGRLDRCQVLKPEALLQSRYNSPGDLRPVLMQPQSRSVDCIVVRIAIKRRCNIFQFFGNVSAVPGASRDGGFRFWATRRRNRRRTACVRFVPLFPTRSAFVLQEPA